ncbi:MAG: xanthine dehydrogenase accessory protein XdhC [Pseudomonadota bacterium]
MGGSPDDWLEALSGLRERGEACVLVTLTEVKGSAPRDPGTKMVVTRLRQFGSIGGGHLELKATEIARGMLADAASVPRLETLSLGPQLGQCCGGKVALLFEPFASERLVVAIFGAGHVGKALVRTLAGLPLRVRLIDSRPEQFPADLPANVEAVPTDAAEDEVSDLPAGCLALVMTHSHDLDLALCERLLKRGDCRYIGLIGSETKWKRFEARLLHKGLPESLVRRIKCPIGVAGIDGKHPQEIAIAIAAELLQVASAARQEEAAARGEAASA